MHEPVRRDLLMDSDLNHQSEFLLAFSNHSIPIQVIYTIMNNQTDNSLMGYGNSFRQQKLEKNEQIHLITFISAVIHSKMRVFL